MLADTADKIICHADVQDAAWPIGKDV